MTRDIGLRSAAAGGDPIAELPAHSRFDLLDVTGKAAWGVAVELGLVGYVDADALGRVP